MPWGGIIVIHVPWMTFIGTRMRYHLSSEKFSISRSGGCKDDDLTQYDPGHSSQWPSTAKLVRTPCLTSEARFKPIASCLGNTCID